MHIYMYTKCTYATYTKKTHSIVYLSSVRIGQSNRIALAIRERISRGPSGTMRRRRGHSKNILKVKEEWVCVCVYVCVCVCVCVCL